MPKKSRTSRVRRTIQRDKAKKALAVKEVSLGTQPSTPSPPLPKAAKLTMTMAEQAKRQQYLVADLKRTAVVTGIILVLLFVSYFLFR